MSQFPICRSDFPVVFSVLGVPGKAEYEQLVFHDCSAAFFVNINKYNGQNKVICVCVDVVPL